MQIEFVDLISLYEIIIVIYENISRRMQPLLLVITRLDWEKWMFSWIWESQSIDRI